MHLLSPIILLLAAQLPAASYRYHPEISIKRRQTHCIYHLLPAQSIATFEVFIQDADNEGDLAAIVQIEGPIATTEVNPDSSEIQTNRNNGMGAQLQRKVEQWPSFVSGHKHNFQAIGVIHHAFRVDFTDAGIEDGYIETSRTNKQEREERERQRRIEEEARRLESGEETYEESSRVIDIEPESFEPYEWTKAIKTGGWYRMCVIAEENTIYVEVDIRSSAQDQLGGVDHETGHVYTHEKKEELDEANRILGSSVNAQQAEENRLAVEQLRKEIEQAVKDYDLQTTQKLMSEMNSLVMQMHQRQGAMMKRLKGHEAQARRSSRRIARSGMIETVLYLLITGFQVYTIHSWLLRNSLLGR